jgi:hypothetical protein
MRTDSRGFDRIPQPQGRNTNNIVGAIQAFGFLFFLTAGIMALIVLSKFPPVQIVAAGSMFFLAAVSLLAVLEGRLELVRIRRIEEILSGRRNSNKQFIEGTYNGQTVGFAISKAPTIQYGIPISGQQVLPLKDVLKKFVAEQLRQAGLGPHRLLIDEKTLVLSKPFLIAFQIRPDQVTLIYDILLRARKQFIGC